MIAKLHFGLAYGLPIDEACERMFTCAGLLNAAAEKMPAPSSHSFGERITQAVKAKVANIPTVRHRPAVSASASAEEESFGQKLKKAVKKKSGQQRQKEQAERERKRYPGYTRKRSKGE
jgi:hypothetical protein